jgi:coatomer subunit beta'
VNQLARFLETQGMLHEALEMSQDQEHRFELALNLGDLKTCFEIAVALDHEEKYKSIGDLALSQWNVFDSFILVWSCS